VSQTWKVLGELEPMLDESFRSFALKRDVRDNNLVKVHCPLVNDWLKRFMQAPTKVSNAMLSEVAVILNNRFKVLLESDILSASFLSVEDEFEVPFMMIWIFAVSI
jgi:hypothetical protein